MSVMKHSKPIPYMNKVESIPSNKIIPYIIVTLTFIKPTYLTSSFRLSGANKLQYCQKSKYSSP